MGIGLGQNFWIIMGNCQPILKQHARRYSEIITFCVITLCVRKVITICVERLLHSALKILLHFASMLLHFVLVLHFAAILITFCGVTCLECFKKLYTFCRLLFRCISSAGLLKSSCCVPQQWAAFSSGNLNLLGIAIGYSSTVQYMYVI